MQRALRVLIGVLTTTAAVLAAPQAGGAPDFNRDIRPILADRCFKCHGPDGKARKAKLRLDRFATATADRKRGAALVPGDPAASALVRRLKSSDPDHRMPPPASKLTVTPAEIALLERWIADGGRYARHWAFVPPTKQQVPETTPWVRDGIDAFVLDRLRRTGRRPAPAADRATWLRRVSFGLTGLAPSPAESDAFLRDTTAGAQARVVDRLLASPRFGERMAMDWLDVARYADTYGYQSDVTRRVWPYRNWVIQAFNRNLSYDQFVTQQLAGDLLPDATREQRLATTFNRLHRQTNEGGSVEEEYRIEYIADRTETAATAFLGLTMECAKCHDHKFDPIAQKDFYRLSAFFSNIDESGLYSHFTRAVPTPTLPLPTPAQERGLAKLRQEVTDVERALARLTTTRGDAFRKWLDARPRTAAIPDLVADFPLDDLGTKTLVNRVDPKRPGRWHDRPASIDGKRGKGVLLSGENNVSFPKVGAFRRSDPFSIALWVRIPNATDRAVIFHHSRAWTDSASQGYQLLLEDGRLSWSLIHFWPGDAIRVRAVDKAPLRRWLHVTVTYDGSSRADGLRIYADGRRLPVTTVRDNLQKSIAGGGHVLTIGQRFRDRGFKGGAVDEVKVFARQLSDLEVAHVHDGNALTRALTATNAPGDPRVLAYYLAAHDETLRAVRADLRKRRAALAKLRDQVPEIMSMAELAEPRPTHVLVRGAYDTKAQRVHPGTPAALPPFPRDQPRNRLGLARWLTRPDHPLTARVAVNRLWQALFGNGLVATTENFGTQGSAPTHPGLLDYLAVEFVASGWDVKALLKRIVLSATYRQDSRGSAADRRTDPDNAWLARGPSRRLSAEMLRDHVLHASGLLKEKRGGPSVKPYQPAGLWKEKSGQTYRRDKGDGLYRRSLYTFWKRTSPPPSMMIFDAAKRDVCVVRRQSTNTPLQALVLLNDPQFVEAARVLAQRTLRAGPNGDDARIAFAFRWLTSRAPTPSESTVLRALLARQRTVFRDSPAAADQLLTTGASARDKTLDRIELAAFTVLCSTLVSFDATVMIR